MTPDEVAARIAALPAGRRLVALAGPPGVGKSTLAERLAAAVRAAGRSAQVVPMDGFHRDNDWLDAAGQHARKGAAETFDAAGFVALVRAAKAGGPLPYPTFDRGADATVPDGGELIAEVAVFEGNYLLLDRPVWRELHPLWDLTVRLAASEGVLRDRLTARWLAHGLPPDAARARAEGNDRANGRVVASESVAADLTLETG